MIRVHQIGASARARRSAGYRSVLVRGLLVGLCSVVVAACSTGEGGYTVVNQKPAATIVSPAEGAELYPGIITVQGTVIDNEDKATALVATFSAAPGSGAAKTCTATPDAQGSVACDLELATDEYTLTLTVVDTNGASGSASVAFTVLLNHPPVVEITDPADGFTLYESEGLSLSGHVDDEDEGTAALEVTWQLDGATHGTSVPDSSGKVDYFFPAFSLSPGPHVVQLVATDVYDEAGVDPLNVVVEACLDEDGDGVTICTIGAGKPDCDDQNPARAPGRDEVCDAVDNDCDSNIDEGFDADGDDFTACGDADTEADCNDSDPLIYPGAVERCNSLDDNCDGSQDDGLDQDGDGFTPCASADGSIPADCNDNLASIYPGATEVCDGSDQDCNGIIDDSFDADGDGVTVCRGDCDDGKAAINPNAAEDCDGVDNNCDGAVDEGYDQDSDGFVSCARPGQAADCDDNDPSAYPGATEFCDNKDNNCNGTMDEALDQDADGYSPCSLPVGDCNDGNVAVNPGATESCNGMDDDCDGSIDEGFDKDTDTYYTCALGDRPADCNDYNPEQHPDAEETCNGTDDDCDGSADEGVKQVYYKDGDGDGYGDPRNSTQACSAPSNYSSNNQDCDDDRADSYPGATEKLDGRDNDCDGTIDEGTTCWDDDGDDYTEAIPQDCPGYPLAYGIKIPKGGDCDDTDFEINPGVEESAEPDGQDNNCDTIIDEGTGCWDDDADGYAETDVTTCPGFPFAYAEDTPLEGDCDDLDPNTYPTAAERFDGEDNNCDGEIETEVPLKDANVVYVGSLVKALSGFSAAGVGDINGDHWDDLLVGAPGYDPLSQDRGGAYVVFGKSSGWKDRYNLADAGIFLNEESAGSKAGFAVSSGGDLNKDGLMDLAVGAPQNSASNPSGGVTYILFGRQTGWVSQSFLAAGSLTVKGKDGVTLGSSLAGGGDITGDGLDDLVIGAPGSAGFALILPGKFSGWLSSVTSSDLGKVVGGPVSGTDTGIGTSLALTGLTNGDAIADVLVGARYDSTNKGSGIWFPGQSQLAKADAVYPIKDLGSYSYRGSQSYDMVGGGWVAAGGDINGDGKGDFFIGRSAWANHSEAVIYLFWGGTLPAAGAAQSVAPVKFVGTEKDDCPCTAAGVGDINGDDIGDFVIGMSGSDLVGPDAGRAYLFYGRATLAASVNLADADMIFPAEAAGDKAGWTVGGAGDLNGDGLNDFFVGAPYADSAGTADVGKVYVFFGYPREVD